MMTTIMMTVIAIMSMTLIQQVCFPAAPSPVFKGSGPWKVCRDACDFCGCLAFNLGFPVRKPSTLKVSDSGKLFRFKPRVCMLEHYISLAVMCPDMHSYKLVNYSYYIVYHQAIIRLLDMTIILLLASL